MSAPAIPTFAVRNFLHGASTLDMAFEIERGNPAYRFCLHHARLHNSNKETSEDIATKALAKAHGKRATFRGEYDPARFCGWLRQIVRNEARDFYRQEFRRMDRFEFAPKLVHFVIDNAPRLEEKFALLSLLDECQRQVLGPIADSCLSEKERRAIYLAGWREFTTKEAAAEQSVSIKDFENALFRARKKLRTHLEKIECLTVGEQIVKDRLEYGFRPDSGQRYAKPFGKDSYPEDNAEDSDRNAEEMSYEPRTFV